MMAKTRCSWDWIGEWPVFVYTTWIKQRLDKNVFNIKIVLGEKGDQNKGYTGPHAPAYFEYEDYRVCSKHEAFLGAMDVTARWLKYEGKITEKEYSKYREHRWIYI